jgi:dTDP-4-amino-4,6-dideoxygalactose transaminase
MKIRIGRTLPPAAAPIYLRDITSGFIGIIRGEQAIQDFHDELRSFFKVRHCFTLSSGKSALTIVLESLKEMFPGRDEVLIPAFSCYSIPSAIIRAGLKVRLCDLDIETFDFDYSQLISIVSANKERILCVVPVHLFGIPADINRLKNILVGSDIVIIEDAAQAMGAERDGIKLGTLGDLGVFSLGRGKALSTVEGGIILTDRNDIADVITRKIEPISNYSPFETLGLILYAVALLILLHPMLFWIPCSLPFLRLGETIYDPNFKIRRFSYFQAGLAKSWRKKILHLKQKRSLITRRYKEHLFPTGITLPLACKNTVPDIIRFPVIVLDKMLRENILTLAEQRGLGIMPSYPSAINKIPTLGNEINIREEFPVAESLAQRLITLPIHCFVRPQDINRLKNLLTK